MYSKRTLPVLAITLFGFTQAAAAACPCQAQTAETHAVLHHSDASAPQQQAAETDLQRAAHARISVSEASALVARQTHGSVVQASFTMAGGKPVYTVVAVTGTSVWRGHVNAEDGAIDGSAATGAQALPAMDKTEMQLAKRTHLPIESAIRRAEDAGGGRVIDALLEDVKGQPTYEMQIVKGIRVQSIVVDAAAGGVKLAG